MNKTTRAGLIAITALLLAGLVPHSVWADGDKKKDKKGPVIIGKPIVTNDPPPKK